MVETITGTDRSAGVTYQELLDEDSREVPAIFRVQNPLPPGPTKVPAEVDKPCVICVVTVS